MTFGSLNHYYSGAWLVENSNQAYTLAQSIIFALEQSTLEEYKLMNSAGRVYAANGIILDKNGIKTAIPVVRAQYIIGNDLTISQQKGKDIAKEVDKILGK